LIWISLTLGHQMIQRTPRFTHPHFSAGWPFSLAAVRGGTSVLALLAGYAIADAHDASLFMHDVIAYTACWPPSAF